MDGIAPAKRAASVEHADSHAEELTPVSSGEMTLTRLVAWARSMSEPWLLVAHLSRTHLTNIVRENEAVLALAGHVRADEREV